METMEICECGNITYMIKEHYAEKGDKFQLAFEKAVLDQISKDMMV